MLCRRSRFAQARGRQLRRRPGTPIRPGAIPRHRSRQGNSRLTPTLQIRRIVVRLPTGSSLAPAPAPPWPPRRGRPTRPPRRTRGPVTRPTGQVYRPGALADMPGDEALSKVRGRSAGPAVRSARLAAGPVSPFSLHEFGHGRARLYAHRIAAPGKHRGTGINPAGKGNAASAELAAPRAGSLNAVRLSPVDRRPSRSPPERGLKHRAVHETRTIPNPPELVKLLRAHIKRYGTAPGRADLPDRTGRDHPGLGLRRRVGRGPQAGSQPARCR